MDGGMLIEFSRRQHVAVWRTFGSSKCAGRARWPDSKYRFERKYGRHDVGGRFRAGVDFSISKARRI